VRAGDEVVLQRLGHVLHAYRPHKANISLISFD
jgi:hypothetical protein